MSYIEIYNEAIKDLLDASGKRKPTIHEDAKVPSFVFLQPLSLSLSLCKCKRLISPVMLIPDDVTVHSEGFLSGM